MSHPTRMALALIAAAWAAPAHAGKLDDALFDAGPKVLERLWRAGVRTVGVLPFRLAHGKEDAGYNAAPLCTGMTTRLENVLTLIQDPRLKSPLAVVRIAAAQRRGWSTSKETFDGLFAVRADGVWGEKAKANGFLTGTIAPSADRTTARITIELLLPDSWPGGRPTPAEVLSFEVGVDRPLGRELGYNVASRALILRRPKPSEVVPESQATPDDVAGMKFEIEYDGVKQEIKRLEGGVEGTPRAYAIDSPTPGQKVVMYLQRVGKEAPTLGVVIKLGGRSLFEEQDVESLACKKWLYPITKRVREDFAGFYTREGDRLRCQPFEVKEHSNDDPDTKTSRLGSRAVWIDIDVFVSRPKDAPPADGELLITTRGVAMTKSRTLAGARQALAKANGMTLPKLPEKSPEEYASAFKDGVKSRGVTVGAGKPSPTTEAVSTGRLTNPAGSAGFPSC